MRKLLLILCLLIVPALPAQDGGPSIVLKNRSLISKILRAPLAMFQTGKPITLAWDAMTADQVWTEVRIYEINAGVYTLISTRTCLPGPPISCPTSVTFNITKAPHDFIGRSFDGFWESDDSNTVKVPGPPKTLGNLKRQ